ncbi:uncharacterized protein BJ212DRAFT_1304409 [Suillus subaureus]|uniref:Uncharacterized protein n=1 Tax=Suillus subaureus TaxID=48587 RepID=A0A9P7J5U9_9AGAM|nr:uncharacterized protein BJ212DRAFT_1304409 [Suillus subaureus]KAG1804106.1 hypothetical protein BJ212DRAFT_1304409 [Suillus subaureus]
MDIAGVYVQEAARLYFLMQTSYLQATFYDSRGSATELNKTFVGMLDTQTSRAAYWRCISRQMSSMRHSTARALVSAFLQGEILERPVSKRTANKETDTPMMREKDTLQCALGRDASSIPHLLTDSEAIPRLARYVNSTHRLKTTFGEVPLSKKRKN